MAELRKEMNETKPCPFCGCVELDEPNIRVRCKGCNASAHRVLWNDAPRSASTPETQGEGETFAADFCRFVYENVQDFFGCEFSEDLAPLMVKHGLWERIPYDPDKHGEIDPLEPGDEFWHFTDKMMALMNGTTPPPPTAEGVEKEADAAPLSSCCGAAPKNFNDDSDSTDHGICPACGEHCDFEEPPPPTEDVEREAKIRDEIPQLMPEALQIAQDFSERFQNHYPKKPLWVMMHDLAKAITDLAGAAHASRKGVTDEELDRIIAVRCGYDLTENRAAYSNSALRLAARAVRDACGGEVRLPENAEERCTKMVADAMTFADETSPNPDLWGETLALYLTRSVEDMLAAATPGRVLTDADLEVIASKCNTYSDVARAVRDSILGQEKRG